MTEDFRVLVVDDDFHVAKLHTLSVDAVPGFTALDPVGGGEAALRAINSLRPDLVLLDVFLPDSNGLDLLRGLDVDAFVLTAAADPESVRKALRRGALAYLIKPFGAEVLKRRLRSYARYRRLLASPDAVDQGAVDRAVRQLVGGDQSGALGKVRSVTEKSVLAAIGTRALESTAVEIAAEVGISRATAQRYLSALVEEGAVVVNLRYGTTGRPEHQYSRAATP